MNKELEILKHINPVLLSYEEWLKVGMALQDAGATASDWEAWSKEDAARYRPGECFKKWDSFSGSAKPVTVATLVSLAKQHGWQPLQEEGRAYEWEEPAIVNPDEGDGLRVVDTAWIQDKELREPGDEWNPVKDLTTYLDTLYDADEYVGYVTKSWEKDGRHLPQRGNFDRSAGQLIELLGKCKGDIGSVVGDYKPEIGAWIRFNPLDGKGIRDDNVTAYRFALIESDEMSLERQNALLRELELPIAAMVYSGGKSIHAIVRVDADTMAEYRKRVDFLYEVCKRNSLDLDRQNRNPSRLSRMPGVMREGRKQFLVGTNIGKKSWQEWEEWVTDLNDDLPDIEDMDFGDDEPELAPELIRGILREGHKLLLSGSSKAGKTFALIQLAIAVAEGGEWLGWRVNSGRVLYVNLELDKLSCKHRFWAIYRKLGWNRTRGQIDVWNLRGSATNLERLAPKLIRRALKKKYKAIIIDPIYKVLTGDENSAEQMAHFCNQFDKICTKLGAATIFCHHHSKGQQGHKQSQDRSSGSGVFTRDPDAIIDLIELNIDQSRRALIINRYECGAMSTYLDGVAPDWRTVCGQDEALVGPHLFEWAATIGQQEALRPIRAQARIEAELLTGWRVDATLREFQKPLAKTIFFKYPLHPMDKEGFLTDAKAEGEEPPWKKNQPSPEKKKEERKQRKKDRLQELEDAYAILYVDGPIALDQFTEYWSCEEKTVRNRFKKHTDFVVKNGLIFRKEEEKDDKKNQ